jgi:hypothetical protein
MQQQSNCGKWCSLWVCAGRGGVEYFTIALRVVGGNEKGSLESETVKYGLESQGTWTLK